MLWLNYLLSVDFSVKWKDVDIMRIDIITKGKILSCGLCTCYHVVQTWRPYLSLGEDSIDSHPVLALHK